MEIELTKALELRVKSNLLRICLVKMICLFLQTICPLSFTFHFCDKNDTSYYFLCVMYPIKLLYLGIMGLCTNSLSLDEYPISNWREKQHVCHVYDHLEMPSMQRIV